MWRRDKEEAPEFIEGKEYTAHQMELMADVLLREDSRTEVCRECKSRGEETGHIELIQQFDEDGLALMDNTGALLFLDFPEFGCANKHKWFQGEGEARGIGGENPILFEEHLHSRRRREIFPVGGTPDPAIVAGIYNRSHPQGRKINSPEQRAAHGALYYR